MRSIESTGSVEQFAKEIAGRIIGYLPDAYQDVETEIAARTRFASAVDLCETRDDAHSHHVELRAGSRVLDRWPGTGT